MLFLATNPRASYPMMDFVNDMKKVSRVVVVVYVMLSIYLCYCI